VHRVTTRQGAICTPQSDHDHGTSRTVKLLAGIGAVAAVLAGLPLVMVLIAAGIVAPAVVAGVLCGPPPRPLRICRPVGGGRR
jgi:hypothetical protein